MTDTLGFANHPAASRTAGIRALHVALSAARLRAACDGQTVRGARAVVRVRVACSMSVSDGSPVIEAVMLSAQP